MPLPSFRSVIAAVAFVGSAGCHSSSLSETSPSGLGSASDNKVSQQIIVKFKPATVACSAQDIMRFAKDAKVALEFLRPMSGDACVVVQRASSVSILQQDQQKLKNHHAVQWVEADEAIQIHQGNEKR